jgi:putative DNA primase/helicase
LDATAKLREVMFAAGLECASPIVADGILRRFKPAGDKGRNGWYVLHPGPPAAGAFGCWKRGVKQRWCERKPGEMSQAQWGQVRRRWQQAEQERERAEMERQAKARKIAAWIWGRSKPLGDGTKFVCDNCEDDFDDDSEAESLYECAECGSRFTRSNSADGDSHRCPDCNKFGHKVSDAGCPSCGDGELHPALHRYLIDKAARVFGELREYHGALVLPLLDVSGSLHSLQFIGEDGSKHFLSGARITGCFFTLADRPDGPVVVVEGYATGASIHEATGYAVVCAMNCGNLPAVAKALRAKWPGREIIIAADNDQWTQDNPGMAKATEAAKAINAKLAIPKFKDNSSRPTDFNDLHHTQGLDTVKTQIENATTATETDNETFERLAKLTPADYDRCRNNEATRLKIRVGILDDEVVKRRSKVGENLQGGGLDLADLELWPDPVNGAEVLNSVAASFSRYVVLPEGAADALALWAAHTHCFEHFVHTPRLNISSPEKGCGKTTLRDVLAVLVPRPLPTENLSVAVLFRVIEKYMPTVLADEYDSWLGDNEELRGLLNAGHKRGGQALRCEGDNHEVRGFRVFAPALLCGIGALPGTLHDRSIRIRLERAKEGEVSERFDSRHTEREQILCRKLARFCADNGERLAQCEPTLPPGAFNRLADNWRPLFAVAEIAGGDWPQRAAVAFAKLTSKEDADAQGIRTMLLADIRQIMTEKKVHRIFSRELVESLCAMTDRPWPEAHRGKPITEAWLARHLHSFGITPQTLRIGTGRAKGYESADFAGVFERYPPDGKSRTCQTILGQPLDQLSINGGLSGATPFRSGPRHCGQSAPIPGARDTRKPVRNSDLQTPWRREPGCLFICTAHIRPGSVCKEKGFAGFALAGLAAEVAGENWPAAEPFQRRPHRERPWPGIAPFAKRPPRGAPRSFAAQIKRSLTIFSNYKAPVTVKGKGVLRSNGKSDHFAASLVAAPVQLAMDFFNFNPP